LPIPVQFQGRLSVPAVAAPMFLVSNPDLVVETCRAGIIGTFPALNNRSSEAYAAWLVEIRERLDRIERDTGRRCAPFGVNLIVHKSNPRLQADLEISIRHKVPLIITSLGAVKELVGAVQGYGGLVFHDVINMRHARKAAEAGVDGLIAVCAGAGGHAGLLSPFALIPEIRAFFTKTVLLSGVMSTGRHIAAARMLGADLAYLGTRFIATRESMAPAAFKDMIVATDAADIVYTAAISGVHGNFLKPSIDATGVPVDLTASTKQLNLDHETRAWKNVWSAGQGVGSIDDCPSTAELCARLIAEYRDAIAEAAAETQSRAA
jgi:nitronate monooxygenase